MVFLEFSVKISALEEYGVRCMVLLAREDGASVTLPEFSTREGLSQPYVAKLLRILRESGLVISERGRNGGYTLTRPASEITLLEIFQALGEPIFDHEHCERYKGDLEECIHQKDCVVRGIWKTLNRFIAEFFRGITLDQLARGKYRMPIDLDVAGLSRGSIAGEHPASLQAT